MSALRCLVIGGGIGGLTAAIALRQRGVDVDVIEKDPTWSVYGVGIIQQANVVRAMAQLGLVDEYLAISFGFESVKMFAPTGALIAEIPSPRLAGENYPANIGVPRPALHKVLGDRTKAAGAKVALGVTAQSVIDDGAWVDVAFSNGDKKRYDFVVGADGVYSQTRAQLFPDAAKPNFTGQAVWRYNFRRPDDVNTMHVYHTREGVGLVPLSKDSIYLYLVTAADSTRVERAGIAAKLRDKLSSAPEAIARLADQVVDDNAVVYKPLETVFLAGPWHKGRIVLLGDAVHATTPHLGQGAGLAIEDSLVLAEEVTTRASLAEAFVAYRERRYERCKFIVESSISVGEYQLGKRDALDYSALARRMFEVTAAPI